MSEHLGPYLLGMAELAQLWLAPHYCQHRLARVMKREPFNILCGRPVVPALVDRGEYVLHCSLHGRIYFAMAGANKREVSL